MSLSFLVMCWFHIKTVTASQTVVFSTMDSDRLTLEQQLGATLNIWFTQAVLIEGCLCVQINPEKAKTHTLPHVYIHSHTQLSVKTDAVWYNSQPCNKSCNCEGCNVRNTVLTFKWLELLSWTFISCCIYIRDRSIFVFSGPTRITILVMKDTNNQYLEQMYIWSKN